LKFLFFFAVVLCLDCKLTGEASATDVPACSASPSLKEMTELLTPAREVTISRSAAKTANRFEIRVFRCLVNRNIIVSKVFSVLVIE